MRPPTTTRHARTLLLARVALTVAIFGIAILAGVHSAFVPLEAHADEAAAEPGVVYVQHRFGDGSETAPLRSFSTLDTDNTYTARINASGGAVDVTGRWTVIVGETDITEECSYDDQSGLVSIPKKYLYTPVQVTVDLDATQSAAAFEVNVSVVASHEQGQTASTRLDTTAERTSLSIAVPSGIKAVVQDSRVLDPSEYSIADGILTIEGRSALTGSFTVYLDGFEPEITQRNPIQEHLDTSIERSLDFAPMDSTPSLLSVAGGSSFSGSGWIYSTNPGSGDWDYTDYVLNWWGGTFYLTCCQHGWLRMPEALAGGGTKGFTATYKGSDVVYSYNTTDATTVYHHTVYRDNYYIYVNAGEWQDVDGNWSEERDVVTSTSPRYGSLELWKKSAKPSITDGNSNYSLAGAEYGIYYNAACTDLYYKNTTKADGTWRDNNNVPPRTYYVKELKAPKGYELDPTVYTAVVKADAITYVGLNGNGGWVLEPPKTVTVRYYLDGDPTPFYVVPNLPLGTNYTETTPSMQYATGAARKPNCTPGLKAWYTNESLTKKYTGSILMSDLNLYGRNIATLTYAVTPASKLTADLEVKATMSDSAQALNLYNDILPKARQANWNSTVTLTEPEYSTLYHFDDERWRTLRRSETGWHDNPAATGAPKTSQKILHDTTVYTEWGISTYDGIVMW